MIYSLLFEIIVYFCKLNDISDNHFMVAGYFSKLITIIDIYYAKSGL